MELISTINNVYGTIYTCYVRVVMCLEQSDSAVVKQICWPWVNTIPTSTWPGSKHKQQATTSVKIQTPDTFYQEHIVVCK